MPVPLSYPGVYVEEVPSGVRAITGVATSITAFVGRTARGPVNQPVSISSYADFERIFGGLWLDSSLPFAVRDFYQNGGSRAIIVRLDNGATAAAISLPTGAAAPDDVLLLNASSSGVWGDNLSATVDHNTADAANPNHFNLTISETDGASETFLNLSINAGDTRYGPEVLDQASKLVTFTKSGGAWVVPDTRPSEGTTTATAASGGDGSALTANLFTNAGPKGGINALEDTDLFNLLCIPPYLDSGNVDDAVVTAAATYCEDRRAMLIVDPPTAWTDSNTAVTAFTTSTSPGTRSKNAALFFPRIRMTNPLRENRMEDYAPCGAVAGIMARTDANRGVWKAPAGLNARLKGVSQLSIPLTNLENGNLNPLGVNCLRFMPGAGPVVWGARTLEGNDILASQWKYVPVRRLALFLEESLYRGTQWAVFEPNDEPLWSQLRLNLGAFMQNLFRQGAFQGSTPDAAYFVKVDRETTTQTDIDLGVVNIHVGFAPLKPAEFVVLKIQQMAGQSEA